MLLFSTICTVGYSNTTFSAEFPILKTVSENTYLNPTFEGFSMSIEQVDANVGDQICLDLTVTGFMDILGAQFSLSYDPAVLQFVSVGNFGLPGLTETLFGLPVTNGTTPGVISLSWFDNSLNGVNLDDGSVIFEVCFDVIATGDGAVAFSNSPTAIEVTDANEQIVQGVTTNDGGDSDVGNNGGGNNGGGNNGGGNNGGGNNGGGNNGGGNNGGGNNGGDNGCGGTPDGFTLNIENVSGNTGDQVCLDITAQNFNQILGVQFGLSYDPAVLEFVSVGNFNLPGLTESLFGLPAPHPNAGLPAGNISLSWFDGSLSSVDLPDCTVLFEVCFNIIGDVSVTTSVDFVNSPAIEVTDVNEQTVPSTTNDGEVVVNGGGNSGGGDLQINISSGTIPRGDEICLDVTVDNFSDIIGVQFSLAYDPGQLEFVSIGNFGLPGLTINNFGTPGPNGTSPGQVSLTWTDQTFNGVDLADGTVLFQVCFNAIGTPGTNAPVTFSNSPTNLEITDSGEQIVNPVNTQNGAVQIEMGAIEGFVLFASDETVCPDDNNGEFCIQISTQDFTNLIGVQFSMDYNPAELQFLSVGNLNLTDLTIDRFGTPTSTDPTQPGKISLAWFDQSVSGVTVPDGTVIFEICFRTIAGTGTTTNLTFSNSPTSIEASNANEEIIPFNAVGSTITISCAPPLSLSANITDVDCFGESTGAIDLSVSGGSGSFQYSWSFQNANTEDISGLSAGQYTVTVTDQNDGQTAMQTFNVLQPANGISIDNVSITDVSCNGENDGRIDLTVSGGTGTLSYNWAGPGQLPNSPNLTNLGGFDFYRVTITDQSGCQEVSSLLPVNEPGQLSIGVDNIQNVLCAGEASGQIDISINGGTSPFNIDWAGNLTDNLTSQTQLSAGAYSVSVLDARGCTAEFNNINVLDLNTPLQVVSISPVSIDNGNDGAINIVVAGGTGNYNFAWTGPNNFTSIQEDIANLSAEGTYCVVVTDNNGCTEQACADIVQRLKISNFSIDRACVGGTNGGIDIDIVGGQQPFTFDWRDNNNSQVSNNEDLAGVGPGIYGVTVTDANNEQISGSFEVTAFPEIILSANVTPSINGNDGSITLNISGGSPGYTVLWDGGESSSTRTNLSPGEYCVTITDQNNCTVETCFTVPAAPLRVEPTIVDVSCNGDQNGSIRLQITGGVGPYIVVFDDGVEMSSPDGSIIRNNLPPGEYGFTVRDAQNTELPMTAIVDEPNQLQVESITVVHDTEDLGCTGSISINLQGGTQPYSAQWNIAATGLNIVNLCEGMFTPTVRDDNGCTVALGAIEINTFTVGSEVNSVECIDDQNGSINLNITGGVEPYSYAWESGQNTANIENISAGSYRVTVTEQSGNTLIRTFQVGTQSTLEASVEVLSDFNGFGVSCPEGMDGILRGSGTNGQGDLSYEWELDGQMVGVDATLANAQAGEYNLTIIDELGCTAEQIVNLSAPSPIVINAAIKDVSCRGDRDGEIFLTPSGGASNNYTYQWNTEDISNRLSFLTPGTYTVTITDGNNCTNSESFEIMEAQPIKVSIETEPATEDCNGTARAVVTGGIQPYFYEWLNTDTVRNEAFITGLCPGEYFLRVSDAAGCVTEPEVLMGQVEDRRFNCFEERLVITPDGNGQNDEFIIFCIGDFPDNHLEIYNRWGQLVFETDNYDNTWEGRTSGGEELPEGPYYYVLDYTNAEGNLVQTKGSLTIVRE